MYIRILYIIYLSNFLDSNEFYYIFYIIYIIKIFNILGKVNCHSSCVYIVFVWIFIGQSFILNICIHYGELKRSYLFNLIAT